jgi:hypothetical protein
MNTNELTPDQARQLRGDIALVLTHVARYSIYYTARRGRRFRMLRDSLPRFGQGERVTPAHLRNLATVASWPADDMAWKPLIRESARRLLAALADVDIYPHPPRDTARRRGATRRPLTS